MIPNNNMMNINPFKRVGVSCVAIFQHLTFEIGSNLLAVRTCK